MIKNIISTIKWLFKDYVPKHQRTEPHHDSQPYSHYQICQKELKDRRLK